MGESSDWFVMWQGEPDWPDGGQARAFRPPLLDSCKGKAVVAVEVSMSTTEWGEGFWTELDAVMLEGMAVDEPAGNKNGGAGSSGGAGGAAQPVSSWMARMPWECDAHFYARARFEKAACGIAKPASPEEGMRRAALSMAYQNMHVLGCSYPAPVEEAVNATAGSAAAGKRGVVGNASGMAVEGERRAAKLAQGIA